MDESALESYFDNYIAKDSLKTEEEEEVNDELFLSSLPDELQTSPVDVTVLPDSATTMDYNSQNSTAAVQLPRGSCMEPVASFAHPMMPMMSGQPEFIPEIQNVVSSVKLGCHLDLKLIASRAWNVEYKPQTYKGLFMRIREPRTTASIYKSGKIVCTGAKSTEKSRLATRKYARKLQKLGFPVRFLNFKIHNLVASCKTFPIRLERLSYHPHCSYEPELFPALNYKGMHGVAVTIFPSGKMSFTGAKKEAEIHEVFDTIYPILCCVRR